MVKKVATKKVVKTAVKAEKSKNIMTSSVKDTKVDSTETKVAVEKLKEPPTMLIAGEREIASDFALKVYDKFDQMIKSIVLFGSSAKKISTPDSDIDIIIIIDDVGIRWDEELIAWYREELRKLIQINPYSKALHINTVKLSTWWDDMMRGDPVVINVLRYGDALVDFGGFFNPLRILLKEGKIRSTPESIYTLLQRAPGHMMRARQSMLMVVDGLYWTMVDAAHAALIAGNIQPSSPEEISEVMTENFVDKKMLNKKYVGYYEEIRIVAKEIVHGKLTRVKGKDLDTWFEMVDEFLGEMARLVDELIDSR
jgi:predicted nucleotidyltransferase